MITSPEKKSAKKHVISIRLNWRQYFAEFCEVHGKDPILIDNKLLFRDGWQYSPTDFAGPEYPPPTDRENLRKLQIHYWITRYKMERRERHLLLRRRSSLKSFQSNKSASLQQTVIFENEETKEREISVQAMDLSLFEGRIEWLDQDLKECTKQIKQL